MIMIEPLPELTRSEKLIIANTARYHRKSYPSMDHTTYAILTDRERHCVDLLAPLLRLADGLDRSHKSVVRELTCRISDESVQLVIDSDAQTDCAAEMEAATTRSELFRTVYKRDVKVVRDVRNAPEVSV
jgi:exopolyphosphatase/guanosine-5'-triphosphate,3'-diphosphate pyrophosphatase